MGAMGQDRSPVNPRGRTVVPPEIRDALHLSPGDELLWQRHADGTVTVTTRRALVEALHGSWKRAGVPASSNDVLRARRDDQRREAAERGEPDPGPRSDLDPRGDLA